METSLLAAECVRTLAPGASAELFERIFGRVHGYFRRMTRDSHDADECLQETLLLLERSLRQKTYDPGRSFNTWIWLKARSVWIDWCRKRSRRPEQLATGVEPVAGDAEGEVDRKLDAERLLEEVAARLGPEVQEMFLLYYDGGLTQEEVAAVVGRDPKTVRKHIRAAHELLERLLGR